MTYSVVDEAVRSRPPLSKVKEAFLALGVSEQVLQSEEETCHGDMGEALEKIAKEDPETVGNEEGRICKYYTSTVLSLPSYGRCDKMTSCLPTT